MKQQTEYPIIQYPISHESGICEATIDCKTNINLFNIHLVSKLVSSSVKCQMNVIDYCLFNIHLVMSLVSPLFTHQLNVKKRHINLFNIHSVKSPVSPSMTYHLNKNNIY